MAEEVVVGEQLTGEMIEAGKRLLRALDSSRLRFSGAFWLYMSDSEAWRLVLVSQEVNIHGPRKVYGDIQDVLLKSQERKKLRLSDITVMENDAEFITSLRRAVGTSDGIAGIRFSRNSINGHYIEDAYIYRLT